VRAALAVITAGLAFLLAVPYALLVPDRFREDVGYELLVHPREGHVDIFRDTGDGWSYHLLQNLPYALGVPLLVLGVAGVGLLLARRRRGDVVLTLFALPYFFGLGLSKVRFLRYTLPLVPVLAIAAAALLERLAAFPRGKIASRALGGLTVATCATLTLIQLVAMLRPDPRTRAAEWIAANVPPGGKVGLPTVPWFTTAPVTPWNGGERSRDHFEHEPSPWRFVLCENWDLTPFDRTHPNSYAMDVFVMSEFDWRDAERLDDPRERAFRAALARQYDLAARFEGLPVSARRLFGRPFPPHDWLYPFAEVQVWRRRDALNRRGE
jgi:hypothetical protein